MTVRPVRLYTRLYVARTAPVSPTAPPRNVGAMSASRRVRWHDVLRAEPDPPRPLTATELRRLHDLGFQTLAKHLAAGVCPKCEMSRIGTGHRQLCAEPDAKRDPLPAPVAPLQPWEPRPSRHLRDAA